MIDTNDTTHICIVAMIWRFDLDNRIKSDNRECTLMMVLYTIGCIIFLFVGIFLMWTSDGNLFMFTFGLLFGIIGGLLGAKARGAI